MPAGLGGGGALAVALEATMGTYVQPTTAGTVWVPILNESLAYTEDKYYSAQIRQETMVSEVKRSYYHVEGDIELEVDPKFIPYFLYAGRHTIAKTGATAPFTYRYVPSSSGSAFTGAGASTPKTLSITVIRNGIGFGYAGCAVNSFEFRIEDGVLVATLGILGLTEEEPTPSLGTPAWTAADLFGADAHSIYTAAAAVAPTFGTTPLVNFNGFSFGVDFNGEAQNRIRPDRGASYISFGETEANYDTELDFEDRDDYNNFRDSNTRAISLESIEGGATFALAPRAFRIDANRSVFDSYEVGLGGMDELIMASVTGKVLGLAGGSGYAIEVKSAADIGT
jgi:hypothetical protein